MGRAWPGRGLSVALEWAGGGARIQRRGPACDLRGEAQITRISHAKWAVSALPRCAVGSCEDFSERLFEPPSPGPLRGRAPCRAPRASLRVLGSSSKSFGGEAPLYAGGARASPCRGKTHDVALVGRVLKYIRFGDHHPEPATGVKGLLRHVVRSRSTAGFGALEDRPTNLRGRTRCSGGRAQPDRHRPGAGRATRRHRRAPAVTSATVMSSQVMPVGWWDGYGWQAATPIPPPETPFRTSEVVDQAMLLPVSGGGVKGPRGNCAASVPPVRDQTTEVEGGE